MLALSLLLGCGSSGSGSPVASALAAAFTPAPAQIVTNQTVAFTDASSGSPTSWSWNFEDGAVSTARNPTHAFTSPGTYTVSLQVGDGTATSTAARTLVVDPPGAGFNGNLILGVPGPSSIKASLFSPDQSGTAYLAYGTASGTYTAQTAPVALAAGKPLVVALTGLAADASYFYRVYFMQEGLGAFLPGAEGRFHTARPAGSTFSFTIQADSHLDTNTSLDIYLKTLANVLSEAPDFHIDLGDTFMCEKYPTAFTSLLETAGAASTVTARYAYERPHFGVIGASVPLFLVNGNHEGEAGWLGTGLPDWTTQARQQYYLNPVPDGFYGGDATARASWYAWTWGDALFVVLDPFWNSLQSPGANGWYLSLGKTQYDWLAATLAASGATYKFVFIHNLVGGLDGQMRGGVEAAPYFEWGGGDNQTAPATFAQMRPGWTLPIHDLLVKNKVTAVFHGHDHLYARQVLDGIVYQEVPQPSAVNAQSGPGLAATYHYASGTILSSSGHLRVTVGPAGVTSDYVRTWTTNTASHTNGSIDDTWTVAP